MLVGALPAVVLRLKRDLPTAASGALNAIRPTARDYVIAAVLSIGKVEDCFLESSGLRGGHD